VIVILSDKPKEEVEDSLANVDTHGSRIIIRRGDTVSHEDLVRVAVASAKSILVIIPDKRASVDAGDVSVSHTLLALSTLPLRASIVYELQVRVCH